jgi:ElaB/YqjD/DUF883 family membrane-anchored ribosome-binding protein
MLASQLDELIESASDLLDSLNGQRSEAADAIRSRMSRNIATARRRLADIKPQVTEGATEAARAAVGFARQNPWSTVAIGTLLAASIAAVIYASMSDD